MTLPFLIEYLEHRINETSWIPERWSVAAGAAARVRVPLL